MKRRIFSIISILLIIGTIGIFGSSAASAEDGWDDCPRGETNCVYPGECRSYVDTNNDGICDRSQPPPQSSTDRDLSIVSEDNSDMYVLDIENVFDDNITSIPGLGDSKSIGDNTIDSRLSYYLGPIILIIGVLYGLSYLLSTKHIIKVVVHRRIWNVILLVSTIISALLGLVLILGIDFGINIFFPFNSLFWHVETGIAMGLIAVFHVVWHWRYFQKMLKPATS
ncbi:hypothetical protein ACFLYF_04450 [Chloroflexota bacterium]